MGAQHSCLTCKAFYCTDCLYVTHPQKVPFMNHVVVPADSVSSEDVHGYSSSCDDIIHPNRVIPAAATCQNHKKKPADLYCLQCDATLCKKCSFSADHVGHRLVSLNEWSKSRKMQLPNVFDHLEKEKSELGRLVEVILEACQQIEVNANLQESKLQTECDILKRIIDDRRDAIL